jgi:hypothetical protein
MPSPFSPPLPIDALELPTWERRQYERRAHDRVLRAALQALRAHWKLIAGGTTALLAVTSFLASTLGLRVTGPGDAIAAVVSHQQTLETRVGRLERRSTQFEAALQFQSYLLCTQSHTNDAKIEAECRRIIFAAQNPARSIEP